MASKPEIRLTSKLSPEFSSNITVDNITYHVQTEDMGTKTCKIITNIYLKGEVVFKSQSNYSHLTFRKRKRSAVGYKLSAKGEISRTVSIEGCDNSFLTFCG